MEPEWISLITKYTFCGMLVFMWTVELELIKDWLDTLDQDTAYQVKERS